MKLDRPLVLDACCLINVHASGRLAAIIKALPAQVSITETVYTRELTQLQALDPLNPADGRLGDLVDRGTILIEDFANENEQIAFLNYAAAIGDDGEAASFAIAAARGYAVATDDKKARCFARSELPHVPLFYTLDMIRAWLSIERVSSEEVRQVLRNIRDHGSYEPALSHPHRGWWDAHI